MVLFLDSIWPGTATEHSQVRNGPPPIDETSPTSTKPSDDRTSNKVTIAACTILTLALVAKTVRTSQRARLARDDARAWRKVSLALVRRGGGGGGGDAAHHHHHHDGVSHRHSSHPTSSLKSSSDHWNNNGNHNRMRGNWRHGIKMNWSDMTPSSKPSHSSLWNWSKAEQEVYDDIFALDKKDLEVVSPNEEAAALAKPVEREKMSAPTLKSTKSLYSAIHPHEDWDWTPADHPRPKGSWKRHRLPPWSVGFTCAARAPSSTASPAPSTAVHSELNATRSKPAAVSDEKVDDWMIRSAIWPDTDPLRASEAAFIADAVFKELVKDTRPVKSSSTHRVKPTASSEDDASKIQALEAQVWALLSRQQALEEKIRNQ